MTDIPDEIATAAREISSAWFPIGHHDEAALHADICAAILSERSRQIERDAKIAEEYQRLSWSVLECDCSQEATAYGILATAIRAQQEPKA